MRNILDLPSNLPRPTDDGACDHLLNMTIPKISLSASNGKSLLLTDLFKKSAVLFIYPRAGSPMEPNLNPELWDSIPGARGCTPQSCSFRDHYKEFQNLGFEVYGLSIQTPLVQKEFVDRNHLPYLILSDHEYQFCKALKLPTFEFEGEKLIKRMALIIKENKIIRVFYPVFPPDKNAETVLTYLED
jgi:peroxiredoxin